jgi:ACS family tartrate transporter-like MFS transporter
LAHFDAFIWPSAHWFGIAGWRWLLVLEALPAIVMGAATFLVLPNGPAEANFLSQPEKEWLAAELKREQDKAVRQTGHSSAWKALANPLVWSLAVIDLIFTTSTNWMNFWLPSLVKDMVKSASNTLVGLLVAVPMLCGLVAMLLLSHHSDRTGERRFHIAVPNLLGGLALLVVFAGRGTHPLAVSIAMLTLMVIAIDNFYGCFWSLPGTFLTGYAAASGIALISSFANISGFVGPWAIGYVNSRTGSLYPGAAIAGCCLLISGVLTLLLLKKGKSPYAN